jgi:hypothetical protein
LPLPFLGGRFAADKLTVEDQNVTLFSLPSRWLNVGLYMTPAAPVN